MLEFNRTPVANVEHYANTTPIAHIAKDLGVENRECYLYATETEIVAAQVARDATPADEHIFIGRYSPAISGNDAPDYVNMKIRPATRELLRRIAAKRQLETGETVAMIDLMAEAVENLARSASYGLTGE